MAIPKYEDLFNPTLQAVKKLGGSASISELDEEVIRSLNLSSEEIAQAHDERQTVIEYRLAWARTYLKVYGVLDNSSRGVWVLTAKGKEVQEVNQTEVKRSVKRRSKVKQSNNHLEMPEITGVVNSTEAAEAVLEQTWRERLWNALIELKPAAFESLCQRLLRESGFTQVKVTGRSGDGGIDGNGIVQLGGLVSFPIIFQCKRYRGPVSASIIRDFRGAMVGRADRGLIITTGTFTRDARQEATRDGAPPVDLVDGEKLLDKLKELRLGVEVKMVEEVLVLPDWFKSL